MSDVLSYGQKTSFLPLLSFKNHTYSPLMQLLNAVVAIHNTIRNLLKTLHLL